MNEKYSKLIELINFAKGNRTLNQFALKCDLDAGNLSRIVNGNFINPPTPNTFKKI